MKKISTRLSVIFMLIFLCNSVSAQTVLRGVVTAGKEPIVRASVAMQGTTVGTSTDMDGAFSLNSPVDTGALVIRFIGFLPSRINFSDTNFDLGTVVLNADNSQNLGEVVVVVKGVIDIADRKSPIETSTITTLEIQENQLGNVVFPKVMKTTLSEFRSYEA